MMKQIKDGLNAMKSGAQNQFQSITTKRDAVKDVLAARTASAQEKQTTFGAATAALESARQACTSSKNAAIAAASTLKSATDSRTTRNPVIEKELAVIRQLVSKVGELKSINLQESSNQEAARSAAHQETREMIESLQTLDEEAGPLSEMIEMAREHAEFTQPILKLLNDLTAKLLAEQKALFTAATSTTDANNRAQTNAASTCQKMKAKTLEA
jgi:hypothetical protein